MFFDFWFSFIFIVDVLNFNLFKEMSTTHVLFPSESTANPDDEIYFVTLSLYYRNLPSICIVYYSTNSGWIFRNYMYKHAEIWAIKYLQPSNIGLKRREKINILKYKSFKSTKKKINLWVNDLMNVRVV